MPKETTDKRPSSAATERGASAATHALAVEGWGVAPGFRGLAIGGQTLVLLAGEPEPLTNFVSLEAASQLYRAGRITWCDEKGNPAAPPATLEGVASPALEDEESPHRG